MLLAWYSSSGQMWTYMSSSGKERRCFLTFSFSLWQMNSRPLFTRLDEHHRKVLNHICTQRTISLSISLRYGKYKILHMWTMVASDFPAAEALCSITSLTQQRRTLPRWYFPPFYHSSAPHSHVEKVYSLVQVIRFLMSLNKTWPTPAHGYSMGSTTWYCTSRESVSWLSRNSVFSITRRGIR